MTKAEIKAGRAALRKAQKALEGNAEREYKKWREAGGKRHQMPETPAFHRLNDAVIRAEKTVPWWAR